MSDNSFNDKSASSAFVATKIRLPPTSVSDSFSKRLLFGGDFPSSFQDWNLKMDFKMNSSGTVKLFSLWMVLVCSFVGASCQRGKSQHSFGNDYNICPEDLFLSPLFVCCCCFTSFFFSCPPPPFFFKNSNVVAVSRANSARYIVVNFSIHSLLPGADTFLAPVRSTEENKSSNQ